MPKEGYSTHRRYKSCYAGRKSVAWHLHSYCSLNYMYVLDIIFQLDTPLEFLVYHKEIKSSVHASELVNLGHLEKLRALLSLTALKLQILNSAL